jgi:hypothetical protein
MLLHAANNDNIMFAGRQYPFSSRNGIDQVLWIYNNLLCADLRDSDGRRRWSYNKYDRWHQEWISSYENEMDGVYLSEELDEKYFVYGGRLISIYDAIKPGYGALNFNDLLGSTIYTKPFYTTLNFYNRSASFELVENPIVVGNEVMCLHCGDHPITVPETMRCDGCEVRYGYEETEYYTYCDCCDSRMHIDDSFSIENSDDNVCYNCSVNECFVCNECGGLFYLSDQKYISICEDEGEYVCPYCYDRLMREREED